MTRIALLTCPEFPTGGGDDVALPGALARRGIDSEWRVWSNVEPDHAFDALVFRSCWDVDRRVAEYADWISRVAARSCTINPADTVAWNLDKRYLLELADRGIPIPETRHVPAASGVPLGEWIAPTSWDRIVAKPAIGLSGHDTWTFGRDETERHSARFARLSDRRDMLVQRFAPEIVSEGELSLVFFDGAYSHAARKRPRVGEFRVQADHGGTRVVVTPSPATVVAAESALAAADRAWTFARVDGILVDGVFTLMELELIDPECYLAGFPGAADRFARAIAARLKGE